MRDQHAGCVGAYLVEHDLFDFLLLSLPDNDTHSHKHGPHAQVSSIAAADRQIERVMHAAGGTDAFLDEHAVIVVSDHSHAQVEDEIAFVDAFDGWEVMSPSRVPARPRGDRGVPVAARGDGLRAARGGPRGGDRAARRAPRGELDGVDLVLWREGDEGVIASARGELRFAPGDDLRDRRGAAAGPSAATSRRCAPRSSDGAIDMPTYPDGLARAWAALSCPTSGDVLLSAAPDYEFPDWGGISHVGGGSHGSLHRVDSEGVLLIGRRRGAGGARRRTARGASSTSPRWRSSHFLRR